VNGFKHAGLSYTPELLEPSLTTELVKHNMGTTHY